MSCALLNPQELLDQALVGLLLRMPLWQQHAQEMWTHADTIAVPQR